MTVISNAPGKIWQALRSRLDQWTECPIHYPMQNYAPTASDRFIIVQQVSTEYGGVIPINPKCGVPFDGYLSLGVCVPTDWDYGQLSGLASRIGDFLQDGMVLRYQDMSVRINSRARPDGVVSLQASWNRMEVLVRWRAWG